jgi:guanylate kinase
MGKIITLCGPSGIGKTTLFNLIEDKLEAKKLKLIPRFTNRPNRNGEKDGFEYRFIDHSVLLQKTQHNDFIHFEKWADFHYAIEKKSLDEVINSEYEGIILAGIFGTTRLQATYLGKIIPIYMWSGDYNSLKNNKECLKPYGAEILELKARIKKKYEQDGFAKDEIRKREYDDFLEKRMIDNYLDIAAVYGRLNAENNFFVLENAHNKQEEMVERFFKYIDEQRDIK